MNHAGHERWTHADRTGNPACEQGCGQPEGTLYPLPARLRRRGLVDTWQESNAGGRYYHLTSDGELALASFTKQWPVFRDVVEEILSEGSQQ